MIFHCIYKIKWALYYFIGFIEQVIDPYLRLGLPVSSWECIWISYTLKKQFIQTNYRNRNHEPRVNYIVCLKSAGFHKVFGWFCVALFEDKSPSKNVSTLLSGQETVGQHFPMNCSEIGHSYEAFTYLVGQNIFIRLLSANKNSSD